MKKICIIFSNDILLDSVKYISDNISLTYEVYYIYVSQENKFYIVKNPYLIDNKYEVTNLLELKKYDIIFPIINKPIKGLLEILNIKYIGSNLKNDIICSDKVLFKDLMKSYKIKQIKYITVYKEDKYQKVKKRIKYKLGYPCYIKTNNIKYKIKDENNLKKILEKAFIYDNKLVIEKNMIGEKHEIFMLNKNILNNYNKKINKISKLICNKLDNNELIYISFIITKHKKIYLNEIFTTQVYNKLYKYTSLINNEDISYIDTINQLISKKI